MQALSTCDLARSDPSVSAAVFGSLKDIAAVLLSATMRASADKSRCTYPWNRKESATTMPEPASIRAEAVVAMIMIASFCLIGLSLKLRIVISISQPLSRPSAIWR